MKHIFIIAIAILFSKTSLGQTWGDSSLKKGPLFYSVEVAPKFPGGLNGYYHFLAENLKMPENRFAKF